MFSIEPCPLPDNALLNRYVLQGAYTDCYVTEISGILTHAQYVEAFYTTLLFKLERLILKWAVSKPSTDSQAKRLANGESDKFAAWSVEARSENQLLLYDYTGRTRSWLMISHARAEENSRTRLYFGSAVTRRQRSENDRGSFTFSPLMRFHKIYSVLLLYSVRLRFR